MADAGLFSESDIDSDSSLFHPSTSFEDNPNSGTSFSDSNAAFHDSYFLDHNYVSEISSASSNKRKRYSIRNGFPVIM